MNVWVAIAATIVIIICIVSFIYYQKSKSKYNEILDQGPEEFKDKKVSFADDHGLPLDDSESISEIEKATNDIYAKQELTQKVEARDVTETEPIINMPVFEMSGMMHGTKTENQIKKEMPKFTSLLGVNRHETTVEDELEEHNLTKDAVGMFQRQKRQAAQPIKPRMSLGMRMMGADQAANLIREFEQKPEDMKQANMVMSKIEEKKEQTKTKSKKTKADRKHRKNKE